MSQIKGKITAFWSAAGDPAIDEVGESEARAGIVVSFDDEDAMVDFVRRTRLFGTVLIRGFPNLELKVGE